MRMLGMGSLFVVLSLSAIGCADEESSATRAREEVQGARAKFDAGPTASLSKSNGSLAVSETRKQDASGKGALKGSPLGGGGGASAKSIGIRALRVLAADTEASCADVDAGKDKGTCACPGGGSLSYDIPNLAAMSAASTLPDELDMALSYDACVLDGQRYSGSLAMLLSKKSVVDVKSASGASGSAAGTSAEGSMNMLVVAKDLSFGGDTSSFAFALDNGRFFYAPEVDAQGGYVLTELSLTGKMKVHAKNGTFDCDVDTKGQGACKSEDGKQTIPVG